MLITHARLITWEKPNRILEDQAIAILEDRIVAIGPQDDLEKRYPDDEKLDARDQYVMPGNICAHTHFYSAFSRGLSIPGTAPQNFVEILKKLWWPLDRALDEKGIRFSAWMSIIDAIRHGTTTLIDHHASPNAIPGSLDIIGDVVEQSGIRAVLSYEVTDRNGVDYARAGIAENARFIRRVHRENPANGRLAASFGLHASLTLSDETLDACRQAVSEDAGFHIHVAEDSADEYDCLAKTGTRIVDRLFSHGILGSSTIAAHAVHVDTREIELLAQTGTWVIHQPRSNMNNAVGVAPIESMLRAGVRVGLGNDGFSNTMWDEWKTAYFMHKAWNHDPRRMPANTIAQMAIENNGRLASLLFGKTIGTLTLGAQADLIFVDYRPFTVLTPDNLPWHIIFGFDESMITSTIVAGKVLMKDKELVAINEDRLIHLARESADQTWQRYQDQIQEA